MSTRYAKKQNDKETESKNEQEAAGVAVSLKYLSVQKRRKNILWYM